MADAPRLQIFSKTGVRLGLLGSDAFDTVEVNLRFNQVSTATFTLTWAEVARRPYLTDEGLTAQVWHHDGYQLMTGPVQRTPAEGPTKSGALTLTVESDFRVLGELPCWPVPGNSISNQNREQHTLRGSAESVFLTAVAANIARLGWDITTPASQARGPQTSVGLRFHTAADELVPLLTAVGLRVDIAARPHPATGRVLTVTQPPTFPYALTENGEALAGWQWNRSAPQATRAVVGGPGEGVKRLLTVVTDTDAETRFGRTAEVFVDASDIGGDWSEAVDAAPGLRDDLRDAAKDVAEADAKRLTEQRAKTVAQRAVVFRELALEIAGNNYEAASQRFSESNSAANQEIRTKTQNSVTKAQDELNDAIADAQEAGQDLAEATTNWQEKVAARDAAAAAIVTNDALIVIERAKAFEEMTTRGREKLAEVGPLAGISVTLVETDHVRLHPDLLWVGHTVTVETLTKVTHTARLEQITLTWDDNGYTAKPTVGSLDDKPFTRLLRQIAAAGRTARRRMLGR